VRRAPLLVAGAAVVAAGWLVPAGAVAAPTCSDAAARSAIRYAQPRLAPFGRPQVFTPKSAGQLLCFDATGDGRTDMAVSLFSGGTAGDIGWLFFVAKETGWRLAGSAAGYKLFLRRTGSELEVVQPVYRKNDANCCPTGGLDHTLYRWNGRRLAVDRTWHTTGPG
jgi:hypothetical protein